MTDVAADRGVPALLRHRSGGAARARVRAAVDVLGKAPPASHASHGGTPPSVAAVNNAADAAKQVLFMCPHGAAKSVLASAYFQKLAKERGLNVRVDSAGTDPDPEVGKAVAAHLTKTGYALPIEKPRRVTPRDVARGRSRGLPWLRPHRLAAAARHAAEVGRSRPGRELHGLGSGDPQARRRTGR